MVDEEKEYDLFISYSRKDLQFVERLVKRIESVQLEGRELRCFFAEWDILPGENIVVKLEQGLKRSKFIGLVMSPDWERSDWATLERVIPIYEDPAGYKARVLPILRRGCVIPPSIMILKWFNFQNDTGFEREAERLISRIIGRSPRDLAQATVTGRPLSRQVVDSSSPDFQNETLASNLFPVVRMPSRMFIGHSKVHKRNDVWAELGSGAITPPFAFNEDTQRIYAFSPLSEEGNNLRKIIIESTVEEYRTTDLLADSASIVIEILNRSMTAHMRNLGMNYDWNNKKTYFPLGHEGSIRYGRWGVGNREFRRTLVRSSGGLPGYYAHRSCKATFAYFKQVLCLKLLPGWHFTTDGIQNPVSSQSMSSLSSRWMNRERNHSILDDIRFWINTLAQGTDMVHLDVGSEIMTEISSVPIFASLDRGIEGDYRARLWYEEAPEADDSEGAEVEEVIERNTSS